MCVAGRALGSLQNLTRVDGQHGPDGTERWNTHTQTTVCINKTRQFCHHLLDLMLFQNKYDFSSSAEHIRRSVWVNIIVYNALMLTNESWLWSDDDEHTQHFLLKHELAVVLLQITKTVRRIKRAGACLSQVLDQSKVMTHSLCPETLTWDQHVMTCVPLLQWPSASHGRSI